MYTCFELIVFSFDSNLGIFSFIIIIIIIIITIVITFTNMSSSVAQTTLNINQLSFLVSHHTTQHASSSCEFSSSIYVGNLL